MDKKGLTNCMYTQVGLFAELLPQIPRAKFDAKQFGVSFLACKPSDNNDKMGQAS